MTDQVLSTCQHLAEVHEVTIFLLVNRLLLHTPHQKADQVQSGTFDGQSFNLMNLTTFAMRRATT